MSRIKRCQYAQGRMSPAAKGPATQILKCRMWPARPDDGQHAAHRKSHLVKGTLPVPRSQVQLSPHRCAL